jgi:hypothetical protein
MIEHRSAYTTSKLSERIRPFATPGTSLRKK